MDSRRPADVADPAVPQFQQMPAGQHRTVPVGGGHGVPGRSPVHPHQIHDRRARLPQPIQQLAVRTGTDDDQSVDAMVEQRFQVPLLAPGVTVGHAQQYLVPQVVEALLDHLGDGV